MVPEAHEFSVSVLMTDWNAAPLSTFDKPRVQLISRFCSKLLLFRRPTPHASHSPFEDMPADTYASSATLGFKLGDATVERSDLEKYYRGFDTRETDMRDWRDLYTLQEAMEEALGRKM